MHIKEEVSTVHVRQVLFTVNGVSQSAFVRLNHQG
jgi:hypothetical protein